MNCPHCQQTLKVPGRAYRNADTYSQSCTVTTECCGQLINIRPIRRYEISINTSGKIEDDWGEPVTSHKDSM